MYLLPAFSQHAMSKFHPTPLPARLSFIVPRSTRCSADMLYMYRSAYGLCPLLDACLPMGSGLASCLLLYSQLLKPCVTGTQRPGPLTIAPS